MFTVQLASLIAAVIDDEGTAMKDGVAGHGGLFDK
jgi:hypothetical protein